jgi:hypothetical protein
LVSGTKERTDEDDDDTKFFPTQIRSSLAEREERLLKHKALDKNITPLWQRLPSY